MKSWKHCRDEFFLMASGEADEETRKKLRRLIDQDPECHAFWEEVQSMCETMQLEARHLDQIPVRSGFHSRIQSKIRNQVLQSSPWPRDLIFSLKFNIPASLTAAIVIVAFVLFRTPDSEKAPSNPPDSSGQLIASQSQAAPFSEARYRMGIIEGTDTLNEMLEEDVAGTQLATPGFGFRQQEFVQRLLADDYENNLNF